jgi:hypothetical protein
MEDPREIYEHVANQGARRLRACILAVIPGDVTEAAVAQCEVTMNAQADTSPEAIKKMLDVFGQLGVTKEQIEKRIQRRIESIQPAQIVSLRKIHNSLKDGMSVVADWFEQSTSSEGVAEAINSMSKGTPQQSPQADPPQQEAPPEKANKPPKEDDIEREKKSIDRCPSSLAVDKWRLNNHKRIEALGEEKAKVIMAHAQFVYETLKAEEESEDGDKLTMEV